MAIYKFRQCTSIFSLLFSNLKGQDPSFEQTGIPVTQECFVPNLDEISSTVLE